jgi:hypothetical protein
MPTNRSKFLGFAFAFFLVTIAALGARLTSAQQLKARVNQAEDLVLTNIASYLAWTRMNQKPIEVRIPDAALYG